MRAILPGFLCIVLLACSALAAFDPNLSARVLWKNLDITEDPGGDKFAFPPGSDQVGSVARLDSNGNVEVFFLTDEKLFRFYDINVPATGPATGKADMGNVLDISSYRLERQSYPILFNNSKIVARRAARCDPADQESQIGLIFIDVDNNYAVTQSSFNFKSDFLETDPAVGLAMTAVNSTHLLVLAYQYSAVFQTRDMFWVNMARNTFSPVNFDPTYPISLRRYSSGSRLALVEGSVLSLGNLAAFGTGGIGVDTENSFFRDINITLIATGQGSSSSSSSSSYNYSTPSFSSSTSSTPSTWSTPVGSSSSTLYTSSTSPYGSSSSSSSSWSSSTGSESTYGSSFSSFGGSSWSTTSFGGSSASESLSLAGGPTGYAGGPTGYAGGPTGYAGGPTGYAGGPTGYAGGPTGYAGGPTGYAGGPSSGGPTSRVYASSGEGRLGGAAFASAAESSRRPVNRFLAEREAESSASDSASPRHLNKFAAAGSSAAAAAGAAADVAPEGEDVTVTVPLLHKHANAHNEGGSNLRVPFDMAGWLWHRGGVRQDVSEDQVARALSRRTRSIRAVSAEEEADYEAWRAARHGPRTGTLELCNLYLNRTFGVRPPTTLDILTGVFYPTYKDFWVYDLASAQWTLQNGNSTDDYPEDEFPIFVTPGFTDMVTVGDLVIVSGGSSLDPSIGLQYGAQRLWSYFNGVWNRVAGLDVNFKILSQLSLSSAGRYVVATGGYNMNIFYENPYITRMPLSSRFSIGIVTCPIASDTSETGTCINCAPGQFFNFTGEHPACALCPDGQITTTYGSFSCNDCPPGLGSSPDHTTCISCPVGTYSPTGRCIPCPDGYYQDQLGQLECIPCPLGTSRTGDGGEGGFFCPSCNLNSFADKEGESACTPCPGDMTLEDGVAVSKSLCDCGVGYYYDERYCKEGSLYEDTTVECCSPCPRGGICGGTNLPYVDVGYWRADGVPPENIHVCNFRGACPGGGNEMCTEGYENFICGECSIGYYKLGAECRPCPKVNSAVWIWIPILAAIGGFVSFLVVCTSFRQMSPKGRAALLAIREKINQAKDAKDTVDEHKDTAKDIGKAAGRKMQVVIPISLISTLAVSVNFVQMTALIGSFNMDWPDDIFSFLNFWSAFNINIEIASPECAANFGFRTKYVIAILIPFFGLAFLGAIYLWNKLAHMLLHNHNAPDAHLDTITEQIRHDIRFGYSSAALKDMLNLMIKIFLTGLSLSYIFLSTKALEPFSCINADGVYRMTSSTSIICGSQEWQVLATLGGITNVVYSAGIPIWWGVLLFKNREKIRRFDSEFRARYGVLYASYDRETFWWALVLMVRRLGIVISKLLIPAQSSLAQGAAASAILFGTLTLHAAVKPFKSSKADMNELMAIIVNIFTLFAGISFEVIKDAAGSSNNIRGQFQSVAMAVVSSTVAIQVIGMLKDIWMIINLVRGVAAPLIAATGADEMAKGKVKSIIKRKIRKLLDRDEKKILAGASRHLPKDKMLMVMKFQKLKTTDDADREGLVTMMGLLNQFTVRPPEWEDLILADDEIEDFGLNFEDEEESEEEEDEEEGGGDPMNFEDTTNAMSADLAAFQMTEIIGLDNEDEEDEEDEEEEEEPEEEEPVVEEPVVEEPAVVEPEADPTAAAAGGGGGESGGGPDDLSRNMISEVGSTDDARPSVAQVMASSGTPTNKD